MATVEELAKEMGFNPDWEGPEEEKVTAEEFIRRQQTILRKSSQDISALKKNQEDLNNQMREMATNQTKELSQALKAQKTRLEEERLAAVEEGDTATFQKKDKEIKELEDTPEVKPDNNAALAVDYQRGFEKFKNANDWFESNIEMTGYALSTAQAIGTISPGLPADEFYKRVDAEMRRKFPEEYAEPSHFPKREATKVSGDRPPKNKDKSLWSKLLTEAPEMERQFKEFVDKGLFEDTKEARENYAKQAGME